MLGTKAIFEIKALGKRITPNSTQKELESAINYNPGLLASGLIFETTNQKQNDKSEQSKNSKETGNKEANTKANNGSGKA